MDSEPVIETCPHCGAIKAAIDGLLFSPKERMIYEYIVKRPNTPLERIHSWVYNDDPTGGPELNTINVFINRINKKLTGCMIKANRRGPGATYSLVKDPS